MTKILSWGLLKKYLGCGECSKECISNKQLCRCLGQDYHNFVWFFFILLWSDDHVSVFLWSKYMPVLNLKHFGFLKRVIDFYKGFKHIMKHIMKTLPIFISNKSYILPRIRGTHGCFLVSFDPFRPECGPFGHAWLHHQPQFQNPAYSLYGLSIPK